MTTKTTESVYYVLSPGSTQEEQWTWTAIEDMCRAGEFPPDARVFIPDRNEWVRADDPGLGLEFGETAREVWADGSASAEGEQQSLVGEYGEVCGRIGADPENAALHIEAGRIAAELKDRETARDHFQKALELEPFNSRYAQEVQRRFSKSECAEFLYLRRDPPVWDELSDLLAYPLSRGPAYPGIAAAALFVLLLVPFAGFVALPLVYLWCVQMARATARGERSLPPWDRARENPVREIVLPLLAGLAVGVECLLVVYGVGSLFRWGGSVPALDVVSGSPVLSVTLTVVALAYLPALFARVTHSVGIVVDLLLPWTAVRAIVRMGQEYAVSVLLVLAAAGILAGIDFLAGGIPVAGHLALALGAAYLVPAVAFVQGRLTGRMRHHL